MSNGGKRLNELIKKRGFRLGAVAEAIGVSKNTINRWEGNAPIEKLFLISDFTHIPIIEIIECFRPDRDEQTQSDRTGGEAN
jgi:transcriptional regulator with XRE-family HTH domain